MRRIANPLLVTIVLFSLSSLLPRGFAQTPGACGNQPFCVETNDFIATITSFRVSTTTSNVKVIDAGIRFQNKTNQQLVLGYVISSGMATDDRGNRLVVGGPNGYRGIGYVNGSNFEPKFILQPSGFGDAQFELLAQGWPKIVGFTHNLDLTIDEINTYEGNQHTLGGEFPLHFQGLTNGSAGTAPAFAAMGTAAANGPCGLAGAQGAAGKASSTVSNAATTISSLGSLFGKKKASQNAGQVANAAAGCDPRVNNVAGTAGSLVGAANAANAQQQAQGMAPATGGVSTGQQMMGDPNAQAAMNTMAAQAGATPPSTTGNTPANIATDAYSQAKQSILNRKPKSQKASPQQSVAPQQVASLGAAPSDGTPSPTNAEPWAPPADGGNAPKAVPVSLDPARMPDVIGVRLGMDPKEALAVVHAHYPKNFLTQYNNNLSMFPTNVFQGAIVNPADNYQDDFNFITTLPPEKQVVWRVLRITKRMHINRETLLNALREKYGKESVAISNLNVPTTDAMQMMRIYWLYDEAGHHIPAPYSSAETIESCTTNTPNGPGGGYLIDEARGNQFHPTGWCASSFVAVKVTISSLEPIIEVVQLEMIDLPLARRSSHATAVWYRAQAEKAQKQDLEKSKQAKPVF